MQYPSELYTGMRRTKLGHSIKCINLYTLYAVGAVFLHSMGDGTNEEANDN